MTNDRYNFLFKGGANDSAPNVNTLLSQGTPLQVPLTHILYLKAPAAFDVTNGVATAPHRAIEGLKGVDVLRGRAHLDLLASFTLAVDSEA